jgi:uncharacterized membrane protein
METASLGERISDAVAATVGSWRFILIQTSLIALWILYNCLPGLPHFDPFPFIFLNLTLSFQAAYTGPFVMMAQNRVEARDRENAQRDLLADLDSEATVKRLEEKIDRLFLLFSPVDPEHVVVRPHQRSRGRIAQKETNHGNKEK